MSHSYGSYTDAILHGSRCNFLSALYIGEYVMPDYSDNFFRLCMRK
jgi:hypothetical protein